MGLKGLILKYIVNWLEVLSVKLEFMQLIHILVFTLI